VSAPLALKELGTEYGIDERIQYPHLPICEMKAIKNIVREIHEDGFLPE
jgi:hypothetical protein